MIAKDISNQNDSCKDQWKTNGPWAEALQAWHPHARAALRVHRSSARDGGVAQADWAGSEPHKNLSGLAFSTEPSYGLHEALEEYFFKNMKSQTWRFSSILKITASAIERKKKSITISMLVFAISVLSLFLPLNVDTKNQLKYLLLLLDYV